MSTCTMDTAARPGLRALARRGGPRLCQLARKIRLYTGKLSVSALAGCSIDGTFLATTLHLHTRWCMSDTTDPSSLRPPLRDRREAGALLAQRLIDLAARAPLVLATPDGGVPVAMEIASALAAPLELILLDSGGGTRHRLEAEARMRTSGSGSSIFDASGGGGHAAMSRLSGELAELTERLGHHDQLPAVDGRAVILVDDGLSPDTEVHAALRALRMAGASWVALATPFLTRTTADMHDSEVDLLVSLWTVDSYGAATDFYADPTPPGSEAVREMLQAWRGRADAGAR